jgi:hypothetical protein
MKNMKYSMMAMKLMVPVKVVKEVSFLYLLILVTK